MRRFQAPGLFRGLTAACALALIGAPSLASADASLFCEADADVFAGYDLYVKKDSIIHGGDAGAIVHSNGKVKMYDSIVDGDLSAAGDLDLKGTSVVTGTATPGAPAAPAPPDPHALVETYRHANDNHLVPPTDDGFVAIDHGALVVRDGDSLTLPAGDYFLDRLSVKKNATLILDGDVRIYMASGKIELSYDSFVGPDFEEPGSLTVVISDKGGVKIHKGSDFHGGIYAPGAKVHVKYESRLVGPLVADEIKVHKNSEIHASDGCLDEVPDFIDTNDGLYSL